MRLYCRRIGPVVALFVGFLALAGCREAATTPAATTALATTAAPTGTAPVDESGIEQTVAPTPLPAQETAPAEEVASPEATKSAPVSLPAPAPSLFEMAWDDRTLFEAGLRDAADAHAPVLQGASIYHMDLELSSDAGTLAGCEEVFYTNREDVALDEVAFRLFPNLADGEAIIHGVWVNGQEVTPTFELRDSVLRVPMQPALAPGQSVVIKFDFEVRVPTEGGGNYGTFVFNRDILALAHFYPMVAVYDDEGWNVEIAPESGDVVYADSSFYVVRLSAPAGLRVAASGVEVEGGGDGERQSVTYVAGPARDFYLAASQGFAVYSEQVGDIVVNSYAFPELEPAARDVAGWTAAALESFGEQFGPYPYTELDLVTTPTLALGVEYPGIIAVNMDLYDPQTSRYPPVVLQSTVAHEVAHQWFYAVVGNDQLDDPWLDESLSQYATYLYFLDEGNADDAEGFRQSLEQRWQAVNGAEIPVGQPVAAYQGPEYSAIVYGRGALFFEALAEEMGEQSFTAFLQAYYQSLKWHIATPQAMQSLAEAQCACELDALFEAWIYGE